MTAPARSALVIRKNREKCARGVAGEAGFCTGKNALKNLLEQSRAKLNLDQGRVRNDTPCMRTLCLKMPDCLLQNEDEICIKILMNLA